MKRNIILSTVLVLASLLLIFMMKESSSSGTEQLVFSENLSLQEISQANKVPLKEILHTLSHDNKNAWNLSKNTPIKKLPVNLTAVKEAVEHAREGNMSFPVVLRYLLWAFLLPFVLLFFMTKKKIRLKRRIYMFAGLHVFGIFLGSEPNPMEAIVKAFKVLNNMTGNTELVILSLLFFSLFSVMGRKFICSWGCQLGMLQESFFNIPVFKGKYKYKIPFSISLISRVTFFIAFLLLLFGFTPLGKDIVLYHYVNFFKFFRFKTLSLFALSVLPLFFLANIFLFRPFCQLICPFGLYAWLLENIAINKISISEEDCIHCKRCVKACPVESMKITYGKDRKFFIPDCWSCGRCIEACPVDAVRYGRIIPAGGYIKTEKNSVKHNASK